MQPTQGHDLDVLPVVIDVNPCPRRDRVHKLLVERPIDIVDHDPFFRDGRHLIKLLERRQGPRRIPER